LGEITFKSLAEGLESWNLKTWKDLNFTEKNGREMFIQAKKNVFTTNQNYILVCNSGNKALNGV